MLYNGSVVAELVRSGVRNLPRGQREAGIAIGLTTTQSLRLIEIPQALVAMLPALIGQFVVILKDSALGYIVGFTELLFYSRTFAAANGNMLQALLLAAAIFIVINFALGKLAEIVSRRLSSRMPNAAAGGNPAHRHRGAPRAAGGPGRSNRHPSNKTSRHPCTANERCRRISALRGGDPAASPVCGCPGCPRRGFTPRRASCATWPGIRGSHRR